MTHTLLAGLRARMLIAACKGGFRNEHHWMAWRKKHAKEIEALPLDLRNLVCIAWDQATAREYSR